MVLIFSSVVCGCLTLDHRYHLQYKHLLAKHYLSQGPLGNSVHQLLRTHTLSQAGFQDWPGLSGWDGSCACSHSHCPVRTTAEAIGPPGTSSYAHRSQQVSAVAREVGSPSPWLSFLIFSSGFSRGLHKHGFIYTRYENS